MRFIRNLMGLFPYTIIFNKRTGEQPSFLYIVTSRGYLVTTARSADLTAKDYVS